MFNNLIESRSHSGEFKRRGSFFLYTILAYGLLFVGGGIASIYAYDAHLDEQATEVFITMVPQVQPDLPKPGGERAPVRATRVASTNPGVAERRSSMANTSQLILPPKISAQPNAGLPEPRQPYKLSYRDVYGSGLPGPGPSGSGIASNPNGQVIANELGTPPPAPVKKPVSPQIVKKSYVLNSTALQLPIPEYPIQARQIRLSGMVSVQVLIDETGKVISAHVASGHLLLAPAAVRAAYQARFSPTVVGDTKVKVSGIINYNFVLQ